MKSGSVEQYKRAFARQRARDLAQHADVLLLKDKEIGALQQECRELEAQVGTRMVLRTHNSSLTGSHSLHYHMFSYLTLLTSVTAL